MNVEDVVWQCLVASVERFNKSADRLLLCPGSNNPRRRSEIASVGERAIAHRLAFYLEIELQKGGVVSDHGLIAVDCEYNRHEAAPKTLAEEAHEHIRQIVLEARSRALEADDDGFYVFSIAPDIVVHQRRTDFNNLLVVEVKKRSNSEIEEYDDLKLKLFTKSRTDHRGYGYRFGAWIVAEDKLELEERQLSIIAQYQGGTGRMLAG